jgi:RNA polymerase sigma-70 factor (ECF subfamily)
VFLIVHRALPSFEARSNVRTWVYGICIRVCSNYRQRAHRRLEQLSAAEDERADARTPARALEARRSLAALDAALAQLSEPQRAVFVLHEIEQLPMTEIASALRASKFTLYARLYAAKRAVAAAMSEQLPQEVEHA